MKSIDKLYRVRKTCISTDHGRFISYGNILEEFNDYDEATEFMETKAFNDARIYQHAVEFKSDTEAIIKGPGYEVRYTVEPTFMA